MARVIPLHRELAARGQVELTTTPYYHPIIPLLLDKTLAREAMPDVALPAYRGGYPEDAAVHVRRAVESHAGDFGERPVGMWPSEGSVCQAMIPLLAEHGIRWIATDEEILSCSTHGLVGPRQPGPRPQPRAALSSRGRSARANPSWRSSSATIRCRTRSGSTTSGAPARSRPATSSASCTPSATPAGTIPRPWSRSSSTARTAGSTIRTAASRSSVPSTRRRRVTRESGRSASTSSCANIRRGRRIPCLACSPGAGSAITSRSGSVIPRTTEAGTSCTPPAISWWPRSARDGTTESILGKAREEIYIAEGSDWFWWYGDDHQQRPRRPVRPPVPQASAQHLYPARLRSAGLALHADLARGGPPPDPRPADELPERQARRACDLFRVDRRGPIRLRQRSRDDDAGDKARSRTIWFGFDAERLLIRRRYRGRPGRGAAGEVDRLRDRFRRSGGVRDPRDGAIRAAGRWPT